MTATPTYIDLINSDLPIYEGSAHAPSYANLTKTRLQGVQNLCHGIAAESGWWTDIETGDSLRSPLFGLHNNPASLKINVPEKLMLIVSELGEAMEGFRKNKMDDHIPHRMNFEVELADAAIRIFDLAGGIGLDLAGAIVEKLRYNASREDHKIENRQKDDGKKF